jgi:hypothetical protein
MMEKAPSSEGAFFINDGKAPTLRALFFTYSFGGWPFMAIFA